MLPSTVYSVFLTSCYCGDMDEDRSQICEWGLGLSSLGSGLLCFLYTQGSNRGEPVLRPIKTKKLKSDALTNI